MTEELISFETAKLAKEKGFNIYASKFYDKYGDLQVERPSFDITTNEGNVASPTQSLLQKWLREEHDIHIEIIPNKNKWHTVMYPLVCIDDVGHFGDWDTYEQALEEGLYEALK